MADTIEFVQSAVKTAKHDWAQKFPAMEDVIIIHNTAIEKMAPMYFQQYIDHDRTAFYVMARWNPLLGDCSRQTACKWLDDFMYVRCNQQSSYDIESGYHPTKEHPDFGTMSRQMAISKELLPADNDAEYQDYYQEQIAKMKAAFDAMQKTAKKEAFIAKHGFDPEDPDIIDIQVDDGSSSSALPGPGGSIEQSAGTSVGKPKPIWYGFVFHAAPFGAKLGYGNRVWSLSNGSTTVDDIIKKLGSGGPQLTEEQSDKMIAEALAGGRPVAAIFDELLGAVDPQSGLWSDLMEIKDKYDLGSAGVGECEKCGDDDCKAGEKCGLDEDEDVSSEINEILGETDMEEREQEDCGEEDCGEEDYGDMLSESVIRHAVMLAREVW